MKKLIILLLTVSSLFGQFKFQQSLPDRYTSMLVRFNNSPQSTIYDVSQYSNVITNAGTTKTTTANNPVMGLYSGYFDGSTTSLSVPSNNAQLNIGSSDMTIEFWIYFYASTSAAGGVFYINYVGDYIGVGLFTAATSGMYSYGSTDGSSWNLVPNKTFTLSGSTWYHIAMTRVSGAWKGYTNGVEVWTDNSAGAIYYGTDYKLQIGSYKA